MPKQKTHKGMSKVFKVRPGGSIKKGKPGTRHNTGKKSSLANRAGRKGSALTQADYKRVKDFI